MTAPSREEVEAMIVRLMEAETPFAPQLGPNGWDSVPDDDLHPDAWRMLEALLAQRERDEKVIEAAKSFDRDFNNFINSSFDPWEVSKWNDEVWRARERMCIGWDKARTALAARDAGGE